MMVKWTRFWVTQISHQMALLSAMLKGAKTINRWCPSHGYFAPYGHYLTIGWCWWRRRRKTTYRPAAGFAAGKNESKSYRITPKESSLMRINRLSQAKNRSSSLSLQSNLRLTFIIRCETCGRSSSVYCRQEITDGADVNIFSHH